MPPVVVAIAVAAAVSAGSYAVGYALTSVPKPGALDNGRSVDPRVQGSRYGAMIPRLYGRVEMAGQVIWATQFRDDFTFIPGNDSKHSPTPDQRTHVYRRSFGILVCAVPEGGEVLGVTRVKFDDKTFYESETLGPVVNDRLDIKLGGEDQLPNTWYEADRGVGQVSAHRGYVTLWFYDVDLSAYGDRIPNVRVEVVQAVDPALSDVVEAECKVAKLSPDDIDVTELAGQTVSGFFVNNQGPVRASLEQLSAAFLFDGVEFDGKINFRTRPRAAAATVAWDELGAVEEDESADEDEPAPRLSVKRIQGAEIPSEVSVVHFDRDRDYEEGTQTFRRQNLTSGAPATRSFSLIMPPAHALRLAKIFAVAGWAERLPVELALPPAFLVYAAGDVLSVPTGEEEEEFIDVRIERMSFATPGVVRVSGRCQYQEAYDQSGEEATPGEAPPIPRPVPLPCQTRVWVNDRTPFRDGDRGLGHYIAASPEEGCDPTAGGNWPGTAVLRDVDGAGDLRAHALITEAAVMGYALTTLAAASGLDTVNTVDVHLTSGSAASITDEAFAADRTLNLFAVGDETLQARDVEDLGGGDYRLSHLRREQFDTPSSGHANGEDVVLLDGRVVRVGHNLDEVGQPFDLYPVTFGDTPDNTTPTSFTYGARGIEPGGDVPSGVQGVAVVPLNGQNALQWSQPAENVNTLSGYKVTVYSDLAMTTPVPDFESVEVAGTQFMLPTEVVGAPTLYYKVVAVNELGESVETTGSYDPALPASGSAVESGGATLTYGGIADGQTLRRSGTAIVGYTPAALARSVTHVSASGSLLSSAQVVLVDTTGGDVTLNLPSAASAAEITVKNYAGAHKVVLDGSGAQTIDGSATVELAAGDKATVSADTVNSNWQTV